MRIRDMFTPLLVGVAGEQHLRRSTRCRHRTTTWTALRTRRSALYARLQGVHPRRLLAGIVLTQRDHVRRDAPVGGRRRFSRADPEPVSVLRAVRTLDSDGAVSRRFAGCSTGSAILLGFRGPSRSAILSSLDCVGRAADRGPLHNFAALVAVSLRTMTVPPSVVSATGRLPRPRFPRGARRRARSPSATSPLRRGQRCASYWRPPFT